MPEADLIELFAKPLAELGIPYLITGSVAATLYGEPRATHDIDLVVTLRSQDAGRIERAFPASRFYVPPEEVIELEARRSERGHFNIIHTESGLKADVFLAGRDALHAWAFENARSYAISGFRASVAPPEYVIVRKLEFYREGRSEKHLRDIRSMLAVSGAELDREALLDWIRRRNLGAEWAEAERGVE
ncbi:MAG: nucleotidyltransferase family protein [Deltaproteobacteria bacterium]|nr:nucleotidyltransferase family protein [Deltaproteobacteria bacterium]